MILPHSFPLNIESTWYTPDDIQISDAKLKNWLVSTGSLTERLQSHCRQFTVSVIGQGDAALSEDESQVLEGSAKNWVVREVILSGDGVPWVFARSVLPKDELENNLSMLSSLGNKPLGKVIFNDPQFERLPIQITQLNTDNVLLSKLAIASNTTLSARRSVFKYRDSRLLVAEVFLPHSPAYSQTMS